MRLRNGMAVIRKSASPSAPDARYRGAGLALLGLAPGLALALLAGLSLGASPVQASFPGTNGRIACSGPLGPIPAPPNSSSLEIFTMDDSGAMTAAGAPTSQVRLTNNPASDYNPRYSADGTKIAFIRDPLNNGNNSVWRMNADGTGDTAVTSGANDSFVGGWSPDGTQIVFERLLPASGSVAAQRDVFKVNADGTGLTNLTNNPGSATVGSTDSQPSWSPDGTKIAFQSNRLGNPDIWVMNSDGSGARPLTSSSLAEEGAPDWSPDGQQIVFQSDRGFVPRPGTARNLEIYRMNADGSDVTRLTYNDYNPALGGTGTGNLTGYDVNPYWSPEGDRIVFHSGRAIEFGAVQWDVFTVGATFGEGPSGAPARRHTARDLNDERCSWGVGTPYHLLSVTKAGSGEGTVTSSLAGIDCGSDCAQGYAPGTTVTLTAAPAANGSTFTGFTGAGCSGSGTTCTVTVSEARQVTATFSDPSPQLTVTKGGSPAVKPSTGTGTVTSSPAGIDCGADCSQEYAAGTDVTLTAAPGAGSTFGGFSGGGCAGSSTTCTVDVDQAKTVVATFSGPALTVAKAGDGVGTVASTNVLGVNCGLDCTEDYEPNTPVTLTATVTTGNAANVAGGTGSTFAGFSGGGCSGTGTTCTVTMDQAKTVTATFIDHPTITVTKTGTGTGTVTAPGGLSCGATCARDYAKDTSVVLTATPAAGSTVAGFTGCTSTTATTCTVTADQAKTVSVAFIVPRTLTVTKAGAGSGTVTSAPAGVDCGADCTEDYDTGASVTLTATPTAGSSFTGFTGGGCTGTGTTCTVTMSQAQAVTATFALVPRTLTVSRTGAGSGTVTSAPAGITCGGTTPDCTQDYDHGTSVTLTAAPTAASSSFTGWSGAGCTGSATTCTVTMDQARSVSAAFALLPRALNVTKAGAGSGTVTSNPVGIDCGTDCTQNYDHGSGVILAADPDAGSNFTGFTGAGCSGSGTTCLVTMTEARNVTATFGIAPAAAAPPPPPPPPAAVAVTTPPPPAPVTSPPARRSGSLSATVTPGRDLRAPFVFRTSGRLTLPSGITRAAGCNGRVSIQIKRGGTTISTRRVSLRSNCTYSSRVSFASRGRFGRSTQLKFTARFVGNALVRPDAASSRFVRVRLARIAR